MRTWFGVGTPRSLQGRAAGLTLLTALWHLAYQVITALWHVPAPHPEATHDIAWSLRYPFITSARSTCTSGW
jgi:hypothetical protein